MRTILQIFRKDARRFALPILLLFALEIAMAIGDVQRVLLERIDFPLSFALLRMLITPLAWVFLIAVVLLEEKIPGSNQYWLTRPFNWRHLLAAKAMFVAIFVNGTLFLIDCATLAAVHLPIDSWVLLGTQLRLSLMLILPAFCLFSVFKNLEQAIFGVIVLLVGNIVALALQARLLPPPSFEDGPQSTIVDGFSSGQIWLGVAVVTLSVTSSQYALRMVGIARFLLLLPLTLLFTCFRYDSLPSAFETQYHSFDDLPYVRVSFDLSSNRRPLKLPGDPFVGLQFPIKIDDLPSDTVFTQGSALSSLDDEWQARALYRYASSYWLRISAPNPARFARKPVNLNLSIHLVSFKQETLQNTILNGSDVFSPALGANCRFHPNEYSEDYCWSEARNVPERYLIYTSQNPEPTEVSLSSADRYSGFAHLLHEPVKIGLLYGIAGEDHVLHAMHPPLSAHIVGLSQLGTVKRKLSAQNLDLTPYIVNP